MPIISARGRRLAPGYRVAGLVALLTGPGTVAPAALLPAGVETPPAHSKTTDAFGNVTEVWSTPTYRIIWGQAVVSSLTTRSRTEAVDGTVTETGPYTVTYDYAQDGAASRTVAGASALLVGARLEGEIRSVTIDAFGNQTESWSTQSFVIVAGQAKVSSVVTRLEGRTPDGTRTTTSPYSVRYQYRTEGDAGLAGASLEPQYQAPTGEAFGIHSTTTDAFGNATESWSTQTYGILWGQAVVVRSTTTSQSLALDGTVSLSEPSTVTYAYATAPGAAATPGSPLLTGAWLEREIHSVTTDAFGNVTESWSTPSYVIIGGQALVSRVTTRLESRTPAGSRTVTSPFVVRYQRNRDTTEAREAKRVGQLVGASMVRQYPSPNGELHGLHSATTDAFGNVTESWSTQTYTIRWGQAIVS